MISMYGIKPPQLIDVILYAVGVVAVGSTLFLNTLALIDRLMVPVRCPDSNRLPIARPGGRLRFLIFISPAC